MKKMLGAPSMSDAAHAQTEVVAAQEALNQFSLGYMYYRGEGVKQDYAKAKVLFEMAAAQGVDAAQLHLGNMYYSGYGVRQDYFKAKEWYEKAAVQGNFAAQYSLGELYHLGKGTGQDYAKARMWFEKAAAQGLSLAQFRLGNMYDKGEGVAQNHTKAKECYEKAAVLRDAEIKFFEGMHANSQSEGRGHATKFAIAAVIVILGIIAVVMMSSSGTNTAPSVQKNSSYSSYQTSSPTSRIAVADSVDYYAQATQLYNNKQYEEAFPLMLKAAGQGNPEAQNYVGWMHAKGRGTERNDESAVYWYQQSSSQGNQHAQLNLGRMYEQGLGVQKNPDLARSWYQASAEQGNQYAQLYLGDLLATSLDYARAIYWYQQAANQDNAVAQFNMGDMYENGKGVNQDSETAEYWYRKAADQGIKKAKEALSRIEVQSLQYNSAAAQGDANAQYNLGKMHESGQGVRQNHFTAKEWYGRACDNGLQQGCDAYKRLNN